MPSIRPNKCAYLAIWKHWLALCFAVSTALTFGSSESARAAQPGSYIIYSDYGGSVAERSDFIRKLERSRSRVEIRGKYCLSSCTMMLGLKGVCVQSNTIFGFHGPSRQGARLPKVQFERASQFIASYYPPRLRRWYLSEARFTLDNLHVRTGADLIASGIVKQCEPRLTR